MDYDFPETVGKGNGMSSCWLELWNFEWLSRNSWEREWNVIIPTDELTPWFFRGVGRYTTNIILSNWLTCRWVNTAPGYTVWWKNLQFIIILPNMFKDLVIFKRGISHYINTKWYSTISTLNTIFFSTRLIVAVRCGLCIGSLDNMYIYILLSHYIPYFLSPDL